MQYIQVGNGTDTVDKGVFYITDAVRSGSYISITAYDGMLFLDKEITESIIGDVFSLLSYTSEKCGIELAQTQEEIAALPNAKHAYECQSDVVSTYRDLVYYLAKLTCTFATFDGTGKLKLCQYHTENDLTIDKNGRSKQEISDYEVYYEAVAARFVVKDVYELYSAKSHDEAVRWYDFGDIPIVSLSETVHEEIITNMLAEILKIRYVPASVNIRFNPFIELGDRIELLNTNNKGDVVNSYVMSYEWSFRGSTKIKSVGSNPYLSGAQTKEEKQIKSMEKSITTKNVILHSYTNTSEITLGSDEKDIISINYSAVDDAHPLFIATIPFCMDLDGYVVFRYYLDGVLIETDTIRQYVARGEHFATISNNLVIEKNARNTLKVTACTEYFESDVRQQAAKILSFENYISTGTYKELELDTTISSATIAKDSIKAVLFAQGLAGTASWEGTINIVEEMTAVILNNALSVIPMNDSVSVNTQVPDGASITEEFRAVTFENFITVRGLVDEIAVNSVVVLCSIDTTKQANYTFDRDYVTVEGAYSLTTSYTYYSTEESIDSGYMCSVKIVTNDKASVESVVVE